MYKFSEIKHIHFELSSNCQASCSMCARNHHGGIENPLLKVSDIDLDLFKKSIPETLIKQLYSITLCGNFGDPLLNKDLIPIIEYIAAANADVRLDIHTNGSLRNTQWWEKLAKSLTTNSLVQFGIDGMADTHEIYRVGTSFSKIIENAKAFIDAGGKARWNFITFKHNEHQLEEARALSKEMGFESFQEKQTSRFIGNPYFDVLDRDGNFTHRLEPPSEQKIVFIDRKTVENYKEIMKGVKIDCEVERTNSVYVDALGYLWPCCFIGATPYLHSNKEQLVHTFRLDSQESLQKLLDQFGGLEYFNLRNNSIEDIVNSTTWQTTWDRSFTDNPLPVCTRTCGKFPEPVVSQCRDQFLDLDVFNE